MTPTMQLQINGQIRDLAEGATLEDAVVVLGLQQTKGIAVAVDGEVIPSSRWANKRLNEGQKLEVLRAVQGG